MSWNWAEVWRLCNAVIDDIKSSQKFNLGHHRTAQGGVCEREGTGQLIPRIYAPLPYKADVMLQFNGDKERKLLVTKNGFTGDAGMVLSAKEGLPQLILDLMQPKVEVQAATLTLIKSNGGSTP